MTGEHNIEVSQMDALGRLGVAIKRIFEKDAEIERLQELLWQEAGNRVEIERLRAVISDALDDEVAIRLMPKWCEEARCALEPKP